jgi:hypothetical protein
MVDDIERVLHQISQEFKQVNKSFFIFHINFH